MYERKKKRCMKEIERMYERKEEGCMREERGKRKDARQRREEKNNE
jgi:hypothetical protein